MMENIPVTFTVNGVVCIPLDLSERERQKAALLAKKNEVEDFLARIDEKDEDQIVDIIAQCMNSFEFWCDHFAHTFDPRDLKTPHKRFILFDYQREATRKTIACIREGRTQVEDKSRDMGASWLKMAIFTWMWLFDESFHALLGSRKEDLVDNYTPDSLMGKIDYILDRIPSWMLVGYNRLKHRKQLHIEHPNGNLITGESANKNFGRGPRKNVVYFDEFAFAEDDRAIWIGIQDTAPCKIITSTPCGEHNQFAKLRFSKNSEVEVLTLHWTLHPFKDVAWYQRECEKRLNDPASIAQELDIDYKASAGGLVLPMMSGWASIIRRPYPTDMKLDRDKVRFYAGFDWGSTNPASFHVYLVQKIRNEPPEKYKIWSVWEYYEPTTLKKASDAIKGCPYYKVLEAIYCDPSMWYYNQATKDGVTSLALLFKDLHGIYLTPGMKGDTHALEKLREMWSDPDDINFHISEACPNQWREFAGLRYETQTSFMSARKNVPERLVDKNNHSWDDFKYFFNSRFRAPDIEEELPQPKIGWPAFNEDMSKLKATKIKALLPKTSRRRLYAYR